MAMRHSRFRSLRRRRQRGGFTLTELLVVMGIIILLALAAVPAIRFIAGSRSIEGTQNIVAAMVGRARNQAINDGEPRGVFFFVDPQNDRTTMALVTQQGNSELAQYSGWTRPTAAVPTYVDRQGNGYTPSLAPADVNPVTYYGPSNQPFNTSQVVMLHTAGETYLGLPRPIISPYSSATKHNANNGNRPPTSPPWGAGTTSLELAGGTDFQMIPPGVGLQLLNSNPANRNNFDRYVRIGCIMFDEKGKFTSVPWSVDSGTKVGRAMHLARNLDLTSNNGNVQPLVSQFGIMLYDRQTFLAQTAKSGTAFTEGDFIYSPSFTYPGYTPKTFFATGFAPKFSTAADEGVSNAAPLPNKEDWLDRNSLPLVVDRYDGSLVKGE